MYVLDRIAWSRERPIATSLPAWSNTNTSELALSRAASGRIFMNLGTACYCDVITLNCPPLRFVVFALNNFHLFKNMLESPGRRLFRL
jgi:hypothetical protein